MKYQHWKCSICNESFKTSTSMARFDLEDHLETHKKEYKEHKKAEHDFNVEEEKLSKKYKKMTLGFWIKNVTPPVVRKLWQCPLCKKEMGYHHKYYHKANANRGDKPDACRPLV